MKFRTEIEITSLGVKISYENRVLALGSCFAAHIARKLAGAKFRSSASVPTKFALFSQSRQLQASKILPLKQPSTEKSSILPKRDNSQPVSD